jgi:Cysteine-rich secretory protein family
MKAQLIAIALSLSCCAAWSAAPLSRPLGSPTVAEQYLFSAANTERAQRGLRPLRWDMSLFQAAVYHAQEMAVRESISHQYDGEPDLSARGEGAGARFSEIAENVAEAPSAVMIQEAWMNSPPHRANLLDPRVDSIGISVVSRDGQLYAVEDFDHSVVKLSVEQQESAVQELLASTVSSVRVLPSSDDARRTCAMERGYAGSRQPWFTVRYTAADLTRLPSMLQQKLASGKYSAAEVGACAAQDTQHFSAYSIAVILYR